MTLRFLFNNVLYINSRSSPGAIRCAHTKTAMNSSQNNPPNESDSFQTLTDLLVISPQPRRKAPYQRIVVPETPNPRESVGEDLETRLPLIPRNTQAQLRLGSALRASEFDPAYRGH